MTVNVSLAGATGLTSGTATVLTGGPTAMNSIAHPAAVSPVTRPVGHLGPSFRCTFPASSLTVLALHTG